MQEGGTGVKKRARGRVRGAGASEGLQEGQRGTQGQVRDARVSEGDVGVSEAPVGPERGERSRLGAQHRDAGVPTPRAAPEGAGPAAGAAGRVRGGVCGGARRGRCPREGRAPRVQPGTLRAPPAWRGVCPAQSGGLPGSAPGAAGGGRRAEGEAARGSAARPSAGRRRPRPGTRGGRRSAGGGLIALVPGPSRGPTGWVRVRPWISNPLAIRSLRETQAPGSGERGFAEPRGWWIPRAARPEKPGPESRGATVTCSAGTGTSLWAPPLRSGDTGCLLCGRSCHSCLRACDMREQ